jgi:hypothetical protein
MRLRSSRYAFGLATLLALTACELAPDSGKWGGEVTVHDATWTERYTCSLSVDITHANEVVSLNSVDSFCGERSLHWSPGALSRHGLELWKDGQLVGAIDPDGTVHYEIKDPANTDHYPNHVDRVFVTWTRLGDSLQFRLSEWQEGRERVTEGLLPAKN